MGDSIAHPPLSPVSLEAGGWKTAVAVISAVILGLLFIVSGVWKIADPYAAAGRMMGMKVPASLSMLAALGIGVIEAFSGVLIMVPRFRRWGAWLTGFLLVVFMVYIGAQYTSLQGADCSCFPMLKRLVGPMFFISDAAMLVLALVAGWWARPSGTVRAAAIILAALCVFAGLSYGVATVRQSGAEAPESITVDGKTESLRYGKVFLYFFDPQCLHCYEAAKRMSTYNWEGVRVIAVPTATPEFAARFLTDTGLKAGLSPDVEKLRAAFPFTGWPYAVAVENGRLKKAIANFDGEEPGPALRELGFIAH